MIILSQDRDTIINFDNVNEIMAKNNGTIVMCDNSYDPQNDCSDVLGRYESKERAKEVLKEISLTFGVSKTCPIMLDETDLLSKKMAIYEMPKE